MLRRNDCKRCERKVLGFSAKATESPGYFVGRVFDAQTEKSRDTLGHFTWIIVFDFANPAFARDKALITALKIPSFSGIDPFRIALFRAYNVLLLRGCEFDSVSFWCLKCDPLPITLLER